MNHQAYIRACVELAQLSGNQTGLNPKVAALLVRNNQIIAHGIHAKYKQSHAEQVLLEDFKDISDGDVLYVNLEPCAHHGTTPACCEVTSAAGVKTVVYGLKDPNPKVAGKGIQYLRDQGVTVIGPVLPSICERLNRGFVSRIKNQRPWLTLKSARTKAGQIANDDGSPLAITSDEQNQWSHKYLRSQHDAILVGVQTVINDDPSLNVKHLPDLRILKEPYFKGKSLTLDESNFSPWKIVLDPELRIPKDARVLTERTIVVTTEAAPDLEAKGITVWQVPVKGGGFDFTKIFERCLDGSPDFPGIKSILVEGGEKTWAAFKKAGLVDEEVCLVG